MEELVVDGVDLTEFLGIPYVGSRYLGNVSVDEFLKNLKLGANCQLLVLGVLAKAGFLLPRLIHADDGERFGSKELWLEEDWLGKILDIQEGGEEYLRYITNQCRPFDILFFWPPGHFYPKGDLTDFKKLHVGICVNLGDIRRDGTESHCILHNSKQQGFSALWQPSQFILHGYFIHGIKRPRKRL